jgi:hydrogenase expression/formation protein HypC
MCIGIPMQIIQSGPHFSLCQADGQSRSIDMSLVGPQPEGIWLLTFLDAAREVISAEEAVKIGNALKALSLVLNGETLIDHLFADLVGREPELPKHLKPASARS